MRPIPIAILALLLASAAPAQDATDETPAPEAAVAMAQTEGDAAEDEGDGDGTPAAEAAEADAEAAADPMTPRDAREVSLDEFLWVARPIVVFADTPADPRFIEQMEMLAARPGPLIERDVVILFDTDPDGRSEIRRALRPRGFAIVVVAKDGSVGLRRPSPRDVREIIRAIDNFSLRQEELRRGQ